MSNRITDTEYAHYALTYAAAKMSAPLPPHGTPREAVLSALAVDDSSNDHGMQSIGSVSDRLKETFSSGEPLDERNLSEIRSSIMTIIANAFARSAKEGIEHPSL